MIANILDEAEIEHSVGFVEDHDVALAQAEDFLFEVVDQPPRCADQHIDAILELLTLFVIIYSAVHEREAEIERAAELHGVRMNLNRQLPGRRKNQCARLPPAVSRRLQALKMRIHRDQIGCGLAGAGLRLACDILALPAQLAAFVPEWACKRRIRWFRFRIGCQRSDRGQ